MKRTPYYYCSGSVCQAPAQVLRAAGVWGSGVARFDPEWLVVAGGSTVYPHLG
jgi:hypothetical protein